MELRLIHEHRARAPSCRAAVADGRASGSRYRALGERAPARRRSLEAARGGRVDRGRGALGRGTRWGSTCFGARAAPEGSELPAGAVRWRLAAGCAGAQRPVAKALRPAMGYSWTAA